MLMLIGFIITGTTNIIFISIHLMLMLISIREIKYRSTKYISIHLMLMLIFLIWVISSEIGYFNTSHVNVNPFGCQLYHHLSYDFNTSHVNVNLRVRKVRSKRKGISIHLMLMLIWNDNIHYASCNRISIHLMLMLINRRLARCNAWSRFQYISC